MINNEFFEDGYLITSRNILKHPIFLDGDLFKTYYYCLARANYRAKWVSLKVGKGFTQVYCEKGQFVYGRNKASEDLNLSPTTTKTKMDRLQKLNYIKIEPNNQYSIVTVLEYSEITKKESYELTTNQQPIDNQPTTNRQPIDNQPTSKNTTNTDNKEKEDNKDNTVNKEDSAPTPKTKNSLDVVREFYDNEVATLNGHEENFKYEFLVKFLFGKNELERPLKSVLKIRDQLNSKNFFKLLSKSKRIDVEIQPILLEMENSPKSIKDKVSLYLTISKWMDIRASGKFKKEKKKNTILDLEQEINEKYGI